MICRKITGFLNRKKKPDDKKVKEIEVRLSLLIILVLFMGVFIGYWVSDTMFQQKCKLVYTDWQGNKEFYFTPEELQGYLNNTSKINSSFYFPNSSNSGDMVESNSSGIIEVVESGRDSVVTIQ